MHAIFLLINKILALNKNKHKLVNKIIYDTFNAKGFVDEINYC